MTEWFRLADMDEELAVRLTSVDFAKHSQYLRGDQSMLEALFDKVRES